jgi:chromosome segregation ATPase
MKEIQRAKKLEVVQYYLLGYTYEEIKELTGVSHGSIANIIRDIENGKMVIPGTAFDQVNDLRQLSFDLKKKGLEPSQALLGISFFERLQKLGIVPESLGRWSELVKAFAPADFPAKDFFESAVRLHDLEENEGKSFEELTEEYRRLSERTEQLRTQADLLEKKKPELSQEVQSLSSQVVALERTTKELRGGVDIQEAKLQELRSRVREAREEKSRLDKEIKEFKRRMVRLSSEVDGKEESLRRLNDIGFSDEDLLRVRSLLEKMAEKEGTHANEVKENFFRALDYFDTLSELRKLAEKETETIKKMKNEQSFLTGEIAELENRKAVLQGETQESVSLASQVIRDASEEAVSQIRQEAEAIRNELKATLADILTAGAAVGEMKAMQRKGEQSCRELEAFLKEVKSRVEGH